MIRTLKLIVTAAATMMLVFAGVAVAQDYMSPASVDNPTVIRGCVIRYDQKNAAGKTVPRIHANGSHHCVGIY